MGKPELGSKRTCVSCAIRFFDFDRAPATCPKCGAAQPPRQRLSTALRGGSAARWSGRGGPVRTAPVVEEVAADADIPVVDDEDDDDDAVEPADDDEDVELPDDIAIPRET